jgi:thymidylate synthase (FAD)
MGSDQTIAESARVSYGIGTKSISDDRNLIRYLVRHAHTSPIEMAEARFLIKIPIYVWRQMIRHRTANINELSGRYSELPEEFNIPEWRKQSETNKQGGEEALDYKPIESFDQDGWVAGAEQIAFVEYKKRLDSGVSRELARTCLPVSTYTMAYWKCDLHNILHFLKLRLDPHAQKEIRAYAQAMYDLLKPKFPITMEAFDDYKLNAVTFSRMEMKILRKAMDDLDKAKFAEPYDFSELSKREIAEFMKKFGVEE